MRSLVAALFVVFSISGSASAQIFPREHVPVRVVLVPDALDPSQTEFREVANNGHVGMQRVRPTSSVRLGAEVSVRGATIGDSPIRIEAGSSLIAATSEDGRDFYCASRRRPGLFPIQMWACLLDVDGDGVFDRAGQANPVMGIALPMPYSVFTMSPVSAPYERLSQEEGPAYDLAVRYRFHRASGFLLFSIQVRDVGSEEWRDIAPGNTYLRPSASLATDAPPARTELFGMEIEVQSFDPEARGIVARIARGQPEEGFALDVRQTQLQR